MIATFKYKRFQYSEKDTIELRVLIYLYMHVYDNEERQC